MHNLGVPVALSILLALVVCCGVGAINGLITVRLNVPSFVTTLAMNFILFGLVLIYSNYDRRRRRSRCRSSQRVR